MRLRRARYTPAVAPPALEYDLLNLFNDQPEWFARETIPLLLAWLKGVRSPALFVSTPDGEPVRLRLRWSLEGLAVRIPDVAEEVARLTSGQSVRVEQIAQYAAYGLAGVVAAVVLKQRVVAVRRWMPPDLLWDETPGALRGIEVAGRSKGGAAALRSTWAEKESGLNAAADLAEAWLSAWCREPKMTLLLKVRP